MIAWGYLVYLAIDFGTSARAGETSAWWLLLLSAVGAVACLFAGLLFVARLLGRLGLTGSAQDDSEAPRPPRQPGGRRAAR